MLRVALEPYLYVVSLVGLGLGLVPAPALAASPRAEAALEEMVEMNRKALDELRLGKHEAARDDLLRAVNMGKRAGLGGHQMMARTYLHLGAVYLTGFGDKAKAMHQLVTAVKIRPNIQITPQLLTPSLQETFEQARDQVVGPRPAPSALAKVDAPEKLPEPPPAEPPAPTTPAKVAESAPAPLPKVAERAPAPRTLAAADPVPPRPPRGPEADVVVPVAPPAERAGAAASPFWVGLGFGSGVGWHGHRDLETQSDFFVPAGVAAAALIHLAPELGYRVDSRTAFSVQSRHQIIPTTGRVPTAIRPRTAHAIFLRAHRLLLPLQDNLELWGTAAVGIGSAIRLYVPERPDAGLNASDTVDVGPIAFGPGISLIYRMSPHVALVGELRAMAAISRFAALADLSLGASYSF
jgi:hypothetical protein